MRPTGEPGPPPPHERAARGAPPRRARDAHGQRDVPLSYEQTPLELTRLHPPPPRGGCHFEALRLSACCFACALSSTLQKSSIEISGPPQWSMTCCSSPSVMFSPSSLATRRKFLSEMRPVSSSSNSRNALMASSRQSRCDILTAITEWKVSNGICPVPSLSDSWIILRTSSRLGSNPIARIATFSSSASILPESSVSKSLKASRISSRSSWVRDLTASDLSLLW
mmetsp:Transcript_41811/g.135640  ORF Transcript_41811/g.135640 Transcript_41811/m.135640 type:complete len:225 (+) Transcript_41811:105-779(+)